MNDSEQQNTLPVAASAHAPEVVRTHKQAFISPVFADFIGGVSSLVVGGVTAWGLIKERAYKNFSSLHFFEGMKHQRRKHGEDIIRRLEAGEINGAEAHELTKEGIKKYALMADETLKKAHFGTTLQKFNALRGHQKGEVAITALAYGGIALGSILLITRGMFTKQEQQALAEKGSPANDQTMQR